MRPCRLREKTKGKLISQKSSMFRTPTKKWRNCSKKKKKSSKDKKASSTNPKAASSVSLVSCEAAFRLGKKKNPPHFPPADRPARSKKTSASSKPTPLS